MKFTVFMSTDNAAFEDEGLTNEVARILRDLADRMDGMELEPNDVLRLSDINGNRVGFALLED